MSPAKITKIRVKQIPSEYDFIVTQERRYGQYDLVIMAPPTLLDLPTDLRAALDNKPF